MRPGVLLGVLLLMGPWMAGAVNLQDAKKQLKDYQQNIHKEKKGLEEVRQRILLEKKTVQQKRKKERSVLSEIQRIDKKLEIAEETFQDHQGNLRVVRNHIARLRFDIGVTETEMGRLRGFLASRLQLIYRERQVGFWRMVATSESWSQALSRLKFFHVLAVQNAQVIRQVMEKRRQLLVQTQQVLQQEQKAEDLEHVSKKTLDRIQSTRQERQALFQRVQQERTAHERALSELEQASRRLNGLLQQLETRARNLKRKIIQYEVTFKQRKRTLPWPTRGQVVARFGKTRHPRFDTYIYNKGIDIKGVMGQNVVSVCQGQVIFAEWFEGFGRLVILDHGNGFNTVYAHLQSILVNEGDAVAEGQIIGKLGDSGTWKGPALYFEIRKRGEALNPQDWLE